MGIHRVNKCIISIINRTHYNEDKANFDAVMKVGEDLRCFKEWPKVLDKLSKQKEDLLRS
jgi:hypothetical protein